MSTGRLPLYPAARHRRTRAFTVVEVLVTIALMAALTAIAVTQIPRVNQPVDQAGLAVRVSSVLEAAHTQAVAERTPVTVNATGSALSVTNDQGTDDDQFPQDRLTGTFSAQADGTSSGSVRVEADHFTCTVVSLAASGQAQSTGC